MDEGPTQQLSTPEVPNPPEEVGVVMSQIIGITEDVDLPHDYDSEGIVVNDESSSTIEEEHARLAEEYDEEDCGYEDENASVESATSSFSDTPTHLEILISENTDNLTIGGNASREVSPAPKGNDSGNEVPSQDFFHNILKPLSDRKASPELLHSSPKSIKDQYSSSKNVSNDELRTPHSPTLTHLTQTRSSPEYLSVVEKMKSHPNRRRIVGIVQNTAISYKNPSSSTPKSNQFSTASTSALEDPSIIADSLIKARKISLENVGRDESWEDMTTPIEKLVSRNGDQITQPINGVAEDNLKIDPSPESDHDAKSFAAFKFSSKIREGLDIIYRAAAVPPSSNSKGSSNSLLALAEKEKYICCTLPYYHI